MAKLFIKTSTLCLACFFASGTQHAISSNLETISANVFNFQKKLANSGNVQSQYKLGEMYEAGGGVEQNLDQAKSWYQQAAAAGYAPAKNRLTFLEIKASGYSKEKYGDWVASVQSEADKRDKTSMLLLAQMHREGVGVKKDVEAARDLLDKLITTGNLSVDREIALVEAEMQANKKREQVLAQQRAVEAERLRKLQQTKQAQQEQLARQAAAAAAKTETQADKSSAKPVDESAATAVPVQAAETKQPTEEVKAEKIMTQEEKEKAEKRKRYEAVMRKLQEEQKILAEQQAWAENRE